MFGRVKFWKAENVGRWCDCGPSRVHHFLEEPTTRSDQTQDVGQRKIANTPSEFMCVGEHSEFFLFAQGRGAKFVTWRLHACRCMSRCQTQNGAVEPMK